MPIPWEAVLRIDDPCTEKSSPEHSFSTPGGIHLVLYAKKEKKRRNPSSGTQNTSHQGSGKGEPTKADKPPSYRPPPLASKGGDAKWKKLEPRKEIFLGNDRSSK